GRRGGRRDPPRDRRSAHVRRGGPPPRGPERRPAVDRAAPAEPRRRVPDLDRPPRRGSRGGARMSAVAAPGGSRLTVGETVADSRVMAGRQLRKNLRRPTYVVFSFVQPVMFVLLFRYVFGGAINTNGVDYVNFLMPGIIVQTAIFGALITGLG